MYSEKFKIYKEEVVSAFLQKRERAEESWLVELNRRKLRDRSVELIEMGIQPRDHRALSDYLEMNAGDQDYLRAISATDPDDFQGLLQFLNKPARNPADTMVEFLSWLIDFPGRPFSEYIKSDEDKKEEKRQEVPAINNLKEKEKVANEPGIKPYYPWIASVSLFILLAGLIWLFWPSNGCMYWNDDRYVESSCNVPRLDTPLMPLDRAKLRGFRRIRRIDTISAYAVGKFWYARVTTDSIEIYTARGVPPLHPDKELKKVTDYVMNVCRHRHEQYGKP